MNYHSIKFLISSLTFLTATAAVATEPPQRDYKPKPQDPDAVRAKIEENNMKRIYEEEQAKKRVKSEQEQQIDKIPKSTTITPTLDPLGGKVTIPMK